MKYFNPSYWFKLWLLSAPLFNDKTQGINAKSIDNKNIKDWVSNNTSLESINEPNSFTNKSNYQSYNLNETNQNINPIYQIELETSTHKHRHKKSRRIKKQVTPHPIPNKQIFQLTEKLIISKNDKQQYRNSIQSILKSLTNRNIIRIVYDDSENRNWGENSRIFTLNTRNYGYFQIPVEIRWEQDGQSYQRNLELVLRTDNLYLQGFIINHHNNFADLPFNNDAETTIQTYYHFDFRNVDMNRQPATVRDNTVPLLTQIQGMQTRQLTGISPDYRDMIPNQNNNINWESIFDSFFRLTNDIDVQTELPLGNLARSLGQVIFITAEAMRFPDIYARIVTHLIRRNENINLERNQRNEIYRILVSWSERSRNEVLQESLRQAVNNPNWNGFSMADLTRELNSPAIQILLGYINFRLINNERNANCHRGKRDITNKFWHEKFCDLKPQIDKIQGKITAIKILDENTKEGNLKEGTIYVGTENGVYIIYPDGQVHRFDNLDFSIKDIILDGNGSAYVTNDNCEIYHLNLVGWGSEKLENMESCDLNKELKIYYDNSKNDRDFSKTYTGDGKISIPIVRIIEAAGMGGGVGVVAGAIVGSAVPGAGTVIGAAGSGVIGATIGTATAWLTFGDYINNKNQESKDFYINLKEVNPFDYKKIEILYENFDNIYTKASRGDEKFYSEKITNCIKGNIKSEFNCKLMDITERNFYSLQNFKLKFYKNINDWKLQIHKTQFAKNNAWLFANDGGMWMGIGKGIRLYNDDNNARTKREIKDINEWNDDFSKLINNEQNLPIINNTNFVKSNITSL